MEEVTDTASFQPSCDAGACGRGWPLWCIYYAVWWCVTEVRSDDSGYGWKLAELMKLLPSVLFPTSSHCRFAQVTQSSGGQSVPLDRHTEYHKHNKYRERQRKNGTEQVLKCVCVYLYVPVHVCVCVCVLTCTCSSVCALICTCLCVCAYMHVFMCVCALMCTCSCMKIYWL